MKTAKMSLSDKMGRAFDLSRKLSDTHILREQNFLSEDEADIVFAWEDGLKQKYYFDRVEGRCSIQMRIDFDVGAFEKEVDEDIKKMEALVVKSVL